ncbi:L-fuculose phosphate aldolase [Haemophilus influenzae 22.4-21]|uniref:L-fuculose phosphate aldolase n=1 Tax=Haemophilus influenzae 22.4-21 TaxID=375063 RepID=A4P0R5_HAEIF|nr:L-fuculose phosphate aldolase [Haemophilus influenzae 22.4-21]
MALFYFRYCAVFVLLNVLPFEPKANSGLALLAFIAVLWLSEALHVTITALLVPLLAVALGLVSTKQALVGFADPTIFLFLVAFPWRRHCIFKNLIN